MADLRKYGVGLTLAHQHLHQLDTDIRHAVLGNAGTHVVFRVGPEDASQLSRILGPSFGPDDLAKLPNQAIYLRVLIDGVPSQLFSVSTILRDSVVSAHARDPLQSP